MINLEQIKKIFGHGQKLTYSEVQVLFPSAKTKTYPSGKINDKGDEITIDIRWENQFIASRDTLLFNKSAQFFCKTLEPTEVLHIDYEALISRDPQLEVLVKFIYQILAEPLTRLDSFLLRTPEERYVDYVNSNPDILNRVPDKYLANVLGITPVSLSRIRKRLALK